MPGVQPTVADPAGLVEEPRTARDAARAVETVLEHHLETALGRARDVDPLFARDVAGRVSAFVQRGGKRLRTAFAWCGWRAAGGSGDATAVLHTGAALELLQACALVHDDLVLTGDLALAWADDLLTETALGSPHGRRLFLEWQAMRGEIVAGQYRDIHAQAATSSGVDQALTIATLKSALYTVERPMALGTALTAADEYTLHALRSAGRCAGLAFQLRDDLCGAFGDPALTGKPADNDLRTRKLTYLLAVAVRLAHAAGDEEAAAVLAPGAAHRSEDTVQRMRAALERTGDRTVVESKIAGLAATSPRHFATIGAGPGPRREFAALVERAPGVAPGPTGEGA
ncbi:polyprenyl synthetase family protein [Streptomyces violaceusniger]|uniref:polyprenyl synthetase family protein n=1 Tax=Streptomyces violaceusniger TaxID=68280 RepID=UPI0034361671